MGKVSTTTDNSPAMDNQNMSRDISLLYPPGVSAKPRDEFSELCSAAWHDLGIEQVLSAFTGDRDHQKDLQVVFTRLIRDPAVIRYRQDLITDLLNHPQLVEKLTALLPTIDALDRFSFRSKHEGNTLREVTWRTGELQSIIDCIEGLGEMLLEAQDNLVSQGFRLLLEEVLKVKESPVYQNLIRELPDLLAKLRACASITIGVNLDASLHPIQATLLSINDKPFTDQSLLNKLFGTTKENEGIAPLHSVPGRTVDGPYALPIDPELGWAVEPMMVPLFADLAKELNQSTPGDSRIISLVSSPVDEDLPAALNDIKRSYKVEARPPLGQSYAREIAARYGIRYEQIEQVLSERGVI